MQFFVPLEAQKFAECLVVLFESVHESDATT